MDESSGGNYAREIWIAVGSFFSAMLAMLGLSRKLNPKRDDEQSVVQAIREMRDRETEVHSMIREDLRRIERRIEATERTAERSRALLEGVISHRGSGDGLS